MNVELLKESLLANAQRFRELRMIMARMNDDEQTVMIFDDVPYIVSRANIDDLEELLETMQDNEADLDAQNVVYQLLMKLYGAE